MEKFQLGAVISGNTREADVAVAYLSALRQVAPFLNGTDWMQQTEDAVERIVVADAAGEPTDGHDIIVRIEDAINDELPEPFFFGPHPADPASCGFWSEVESI